MVSDAVAIVTGGSRGIGRELVRGLALRGYAVVVAYLDEADAAHAAQGSALTVRADVTDELDVERLFGETKLVFRDIDVVVHAAADGADIVVGHAARELRHGGVVVNVSGAHTSTPALAVELHARGITLCEVVPLGPHHAVAAVLAFLDRRRPGG